MGSSKGISADMKHAEKEVLTNSANRTVQLLQIFKLWTATALLAAIEELTNSMFSTCGIPYIQKCYL